MDDDLQKPTSVLGPPQIDDANDSDGEEDRPDWLKLSTKFARPAIPKRGEKSHEPTGEHGAETNLQAHILQRARDAMFNAIRAPRSISSKAMSTGEWDSKERRVYVTMARGIHFMGMGWKHWLLPEEALYLIERGSMVCTTKRGGGPMSVQQAFADMIGGDIPLEAYQVYAYLKRLGYIVTRFRPPFSDYPVAPIAAPLPPPSRPTLLDRVKTIFASIFAPLIPRYASLFRSIRLRITSKFASASLPLPPPPASSPYTPLFNVYKPPSSTPFKKSAPPAAPWQIVVVNAHTTAMPTLAELTTLFNVAPPSEIPPPKFPPRTRLPLKFSWYKPSTWWTTPEPSRRNPFVGLRAGKKTSVIAVVDAGNVGFFRFMQGAFEETEMHFPDA